PPACTQHFGGILEPSVLFDEDAREWQLWYVGLGVLDGVFSGRVGFATSSDGVAWTRRPDPIFLADATAGAWDDSLVSHVDVVKNTAETYDMFYFGTSNAIASTCTDADPCAITPGSIGHATSDDGIAWVRDANNPIVSPGAAPFDAWSVGGPSALVRDDTVELFFFGNAERTSFDAGIGRAVAPCDN
ncbi:MAG TPA: hypothetical protein VGO62_19310, partial [Myxococcota bacterium]